MMFPPAGFPRTACPPRRRDTGGTGVPADLVIVAVGTAQGEDAAAWQVLEHLDDRAFAPAGCAVRRARIDRPGTDLLPLLRGAGHAVVLDAMRGGGPPGTVRLLDRRELSLFDDRLSSHALGVAEVLALADALGELPQVLHVVGIAGGAFDARRAALAVTDLLRARLG
jgi:hydrogenase maturation protease